MTAATGDTAAAEFPQCTLPSGQGDGAVCWPGWWPDTHDTPTRSDPITAALRAYLA
jgi:hypothetical protein